MLGSVCYRVNQSQVDSEITQQTDQMKVLPVHLFVPDGQYHSSGPESVPGTQAIDNPEIHGGVKKESYGMNKKIVPNLAANHSNGKNVFRSKF